LGEKRNSLGVLDLFSGIGGFSLGFERAGPFRTLAFCEALESRRRILRRHWPDVEIHPDVRTLDGRQFRDGDHRADVICAWSENAPQDHTARPIDSVVSHEGFAAPRPSLSS
jgi:DNA (cytosine-5)-methyltransferase 1